MRVEAHNNLYINFQHTAIRKPPLEQSFSTKSLTCQNPNNNLAKGTDFISSYIVQNNINFTARISPKKFELIDYGHQISCPCCGEKMKRTSKEDAYTLSEEIAPKKGKELSKELYSNMKKFQPSKRKLIATIANYAAKNPDLEFSEILNKISDNYRERLTMKQIAVVIDITNEMIKRYPKKESRIEKWRYEQIKGAINSEDEGEFRNKALINLLLKFNKNNKIKFTRKELETYFSRLPNSQKDIDAFVVKYKRRSSQEAIRNLVKHTNSTIEHIDPYSYSLNNDFSNLLLMCSDCNNTRGSMPYSDFIKERPEMVKNIKKYIKDVEKVIEKDDRLSEIYGNYIEQVIRTLRIASGNVLFAEKLYEPEDTDTNPKDST